MGRVGVVEAAGRLGVHVQRVHQRIADGSLPAEKVGRDWLIDEVDLSRIDKRPAGRPPSPRSAWNVLLVAADKDPSGLPPGKLAAAERWLRRLQRSAQREDEDVVVAQLRHLLGNRAERREYHVAPRDLDALRGEARMKLSGVSASQSGIASGDLVESYVSAPLGEDIVDDYLLVPAPHDIANVVLHLYDEAAIPVDVDLLVPSKLLVAVDLAEYHGPRESAKAVELVREVRREREA